MTISEKSERNNNCNLISFIQLFLIIIVSLQLVNRKKQK